MPLISKASPSLLQDNFKLYFRCESHLLSQCNSSVCDLGTRGFLGETLRFVASVFIKQRYQSEVQNSLFYCQSESKSHSQSCLTPCDPMDYTVHGILQARIPEWVAFPSPGELPNPGIEPRSPALQADSLPAEPQGKPQKCTFNKFLGRQTLLVQGPHFENHSSGLYLTGEVVGQRI